MLEAGFDLLLALVILAVAVRALYSRGLFTGVIHYIVFGLLMALVWARLAAPDIALAEAAIGAGLTGALLLDAARQLRDTRRRGEPADASGREENSTSPGGNP